MNIGRSNKEAIKMAAPRVHFFSPTPIKSSLFSTRIFRYTRSQEWRRQIECKYQVDSAFIAVGGRLEHPTLMRNKRPRIR
ncbi:hypothetical protein J6590_049869 [Homalodisca vitripennis]|nr:hypothetical protein J6590_049869 [Homalodisca vitripennis]